MSQRSSGVALETALSGQTVQIATLQNCGRITIGRNDAIVRTFPIQEIDERIKQTISMMPADITKLISTEEMADVVEYLTTLK